MNKLFKHWLMLWLLLFVATGFYAMFTMPANSTKVTALGLKISNIHSCVGVDHHSSKFQKAVMSY